LSQAAALSAIDKPVLIHFAAKAAESNRIHRKHILGASALSIYNSLIKALQPCRKVGGLPEIQNL